MKQKNSRSSVIIILSFLIAVYGNRILQIFVAVTFNSPLIKLIYSYTWWIVPIVLVLGMLFGFKNIIKELCLDKNFFTALAFSLIAVSPMFFSSAVVGEIDNDLDWINLLKKTLFGGFMEEILFRGFLFGILFRKLGWGFIPASVIGAVVFGMGHLYQGSTMLEMMGIFSITFIGSAWFAWLFIEWNENLWVPICLHVFMNLPWALFELSDNALGGVYVNIFRVVTIALTVIVTIGLANKRGGFLINKRNLITNVPIA